MKNIRKTRNSFKQENRHKELFRCTREFRKSEPIKIVGCWISMLLHLLQKYQEPQHQWVVEIFMFHI